MGRVAGVEPAWTCAQDMWVAATLHPDREERATAHEAFRIALAAHDVRTRAHAARDDPHIAHTRTHCTLTRDEHVLAVVVLPGHVVVMAAHNFHIGFKTPGLLPIPAPPRSG